MINISSRSPLAAAAGTGLTYEDLVNLPEDGRRYEILDGDLVVTASPITRHQRVSRNLAVALHLHVREKGLGEVFNAPIDVLLDRDTKAKLYACFGVDHYSPISHSTSAVNSLSTIPTPALAAASRNRSVTRVAAGPRSAPSP